MVFYGSLITGRDRPRSGLDGHIEHALAYGVSSVIVLPFLVARHLAAIFMLTLAGVLELAQLWIPGRSCGVNFLASGAGVVVPLASMLIFMLVAS